MVRILVVEPSMFGGLLHYAAQLADGLAERGHHVDLLAPRRNELAKRSGAARMRPVLFRLVRTGEAPAGRIPYQLRRARIAVLLAAAWTRVVVEIRRGRYDAVVITADIGVLPATLGVLAATAGSRRPVIAQICHNARPFNRYGGANLFGSAATSLRLLRAAFARVDLVFVHGEESRREFEAGWRARRLAVIPHGDERLFGDEPPPPSDEERILFFGDWRKVKGLPVLMAAYDRLVARRPGVKLTVAGMPSPADLDPQPIMAWATSHEGRVEVIDRYVPVPDVPALFGRARVVVTPYVAGFQSGVIHLAMTMQRAVVTSDVGDLPTVVDDGTSGRVVPAGDPDALADALEEVVADGAMAAQMGEAGRRRMLRTASWGQVAELVEGALDEVAISRAVGRGAGADAPHRGGTAK